MNHIVHIIVMLFWRLYPVMVNWFIYSFENMLKYKDELRYVIDKLFKDLRMDKENDTLFP